MWSLIHAAFHERESQAHRLTEAFVWLLVLCSVALIAAEPFVPQHLQGAVEKLDQVLLGLFAIELILRVLTYRPPELETFRHPPLGVLRTHIVSRLRYLSRPLLLVDLITVLAVVPALRGLRVLRLLRLLRTSQLFRYGNPFKGVILAFERDRLLFNFAMLVLAAETILGGLTLFFVERSATQALLAEGADPGGLITTVGDSIWWALVTLTTVGYGDYTPHTELGRVVGGTLMVGGMFTLALFAGIVGHSLLNAVLSIRGEQIRMTGHVNHIIVCGYEEGTSLLLDSLAQEIDQERSPIILIGPGERPPDVPAEMLWVTGDPTKENELDKVRLTHARAVVLVGSRNTHPNQADATTILTAFTLRSYLAQHSATAKRRQPLHLVAEILEPENVAHARAAGVDEVIESLRLGFEVVTHAIAFPGVGDATSQVISAGAQSFYVGAVPEPLRAAHPHFGSLATALRQEHNLLVIGLASPGGEQRLNPPDDALVGEDHIVYLAEVPLSVSARS